LQNNGAKRCIATATTRELVNVALKRCNIEKYFLKVFSCGDIGKGKVHSDIFLLAKEFLGEKTSDMWVTEDPLVAIETAPKIGLPTIGIYDAFNYGQERIKELATQYIAKGQTFLELVK
jgi:phosphoglycolate phosphatase-like HAD superfamily hydrolase